MASGASTEVAAGYVSLYARMDAGQLVSEVTNALSGLNAASIAAGMLSGIGSAADTLGTKLMVLGTIAAVGATKLTGGLFDTISTAENTSIAFETMRGSADLAAESMDRLNEFAIKTPYEFKNIATSSRQLMAMGIDFDKQLDESGNGMLRWAGNWASALGLNDAGFSNVLTQMGHISAAGRIYTRNITNLSRNGIAAWQALSDYMGISIDEVRAKVQKGEVDAETAFAAFEAYANEHFVGTMDRMAHTMTGVMSNMGDAIKVPIMALSNTSAYEGLTNAMYDLTDPMRELVTALMPSVEALFKRVTPLVEWFTTKIIEMTESLKRGNPEDLVRGLEAIAMVLGSGPLLKGFGVLSSSLGGFIGAASRVGKGINSFVTAPLSALSKVDFTASLASVKDYFGTLAGSLMGIKEPLANIAGKVGFAAGNIVSSVASGFRNMIPVVQSKFSQFVGQVSLRLLEDIWTIKGAFHQNMSWVIKDFANVGSNLAAVARNMFRFKGVDFSVGIESAFAKVWETAYNLQLGKLKDIGRSIGDTITSMAGPLAKSYGGMLSNMISKGAASAAKTSTKVMKSLVGVLDSAKPAIQNLANTVKKLAKPFATLFNNTLKTGASAFSKFAGLMIKGGSAFGIIALGATIAAGAFTAMGGSLPALGAEIADVLGSIGGTASDAMASFSKALLSMVANGDISTFFLSLTSGINGFISQVGGQFPAVINAIGAAFPQFVNGLVGMFATYAPMLLAGSMQLFSGLVTGLAMVIQQITPQLPTIISGLAAAIAGNAPGILSAGVTLFLALVDAFAVAVPAIIEQVPLLIDSLVSTLSSNVPAIMDGATTLFNAIADAIPVIVPLAIGALINLLSTLIGTFPSWGPQFLTAMGNVLLSLITAITNSIPTTLSAIGNLLSSAANTIRSVDWASLGSNLIRGFINGIKSMASAVIDAARSVISGATSAVTGFLRIGSPSKLFRWIGEMTTEGLALGIGDGSGSVMTAMDALMNDMAGAAIPEAALGTYAYRGQGSTTSSGISQFFNTTVIRADDDLYATAPILYRTAIYEAGLAL